MSDTYLRIIIIPLFADDVSLFTGTLADVEKDRTYFKEQQGRTARYFRLEEVKDDSKKGTRKEEYGQVRCA